jgi:hypothetical protein
MEIEGIIAVQNLPDDIHYSGLPFDRLEEIFSKSPKEDKTLYTILATERNSVIYYVGPEFVRYSGGHSDESVAAILKRKEQGEDIKIPRQVIIPRLMGITQSNKDERGIIDVRDVLNLHHSAWWKIKNGGDQDFYLRDNEPAGRSIRAGEWLPNDICCNKKYLFAGDPHEVFAQFKEKGINFKTEMIPSKLLEANNYQPQRAESA